MGYSLLSARVLSRYGIQAWQSLDISEEIVRVLYGDYKAIYLELSYNDEIFIVDFYQLYNEYATYNNRLRVLIESLGSRTLEHVEDWPDSNIARVIYADVFLAGYRAKLANSGYVLPEEYPKEDMFDIELTRDSSLSGDIKNLHTHCLISVNGYLHRTSYVNDKLYVLDGGKSHLRRGETRIGLLSFYGIGDIEIIPITDDMLGYDAQGRNYKDRVVVNLDESLEDDSWLMVIGGYLVAPQDNVAFRSGDKQLHVSLQDLYYLERLIESRNTIDLASLELTELLDSQGSINVEEALSDEVIAKYMTLSQSFVVRIKRSNLYVGRVNIRPTGTPGTLITIDEPTLPLLIGYGRIGEYWKIQEGDRWSLTLTDSEYKDYLFSRGHRDDFDIITGTHATDSYRRYVNAKMIDISSW